MNTINANTNSPAKNGKYIPGLDLLRAAAAIGVMLYHYFFIGPIEGYYSPDSLVPIAFWGELGVDVFFLLSGFLILLSATGRTWKQFLVARGKRIYPMFFFASLFVLFLGIILPGTAAKPLVIRWLGSLTLFTDVFHLDPLSSVYWTLMVEVKFYLLVALVIKLNIWKKYKHQLLIAWLTVSVVNTFSWNHEWLRLFLNTQYAGHFSLGILLYSVFVLKEKSKCLWIEIPMALMLIYHNIIGYTSWIRGIYSVLPYNDTEIFLGMLVLIGFMVLCINLDKPQWKPYRFIAAFSQMSYTYYLIHADFGFNIRTQIYQRVLTAWPALTPYFSETTIMVIVVILPLLFAYLINRAVTLVTKKL